MIGARHHRAALGLIHNSGDLRRVGGDDHGAEIGLLRAAQNMHDHRLAGDIGERLAREPGRGHAGGNENKNVSHRVHAPESCLFGLQEPQQTG